MANTKTKDLCNSCRFFISTQSVIGHCHRLPKTIDKSPNSWCGEWQLEDSQALENIVITITEPVEIPKKKLGRPKKC
jgi:hypothetical protein